MTTGDGRLRVTAGSALTDDGGAGARRHVVVVGPMAVGKTTVAAELARILGWNVRDSDADLEALFGRTGRDLVAEVGVDELHRLESAMLLGALASPEPTVIAAAASVVEDPACRRSLARRAWVAVLDAPLDVTAQRATTGDHRRAIDRNEQIRLRRRRRPLFDEVADVVVDATGDPASVAAEIVAAGRFSWR